MTIPQKKIIAIHQPNFIPWIGYFFKILKSDAFVILDDVQYSKNSFTNRNKIKTPQGLQWLTLPLSKTGIFGSAINDCTVFKKNESVEKILKTIEFNYRKSKFFDEYFGSFSSTIISSSENLSDLNIALIKWAMAILKINTPLYFSSQLKNLNGVSTERLISICNELEAGEYLCGFGGKKYQEEESFVSAGIKLTTTAFSHPVYEQQWGGFAPNVSIIDLIFNCGPSSQTILLNASASQG